MEDKLLINKIVNYYKLGKKVLSIVKMDGGITNTVYKISTDESNYIVKILSSDDINFIDNSEEICFKANKEGIKTIPALKVNNTFVQSINSNNILVYPYYDGKILTTSELTLDHIKKLANSLAQLHNIKCSGDSFNKYTLNDYNYLYKLTLNENDNCFIDFKNNILLLNKIYKKVYSSYLKLSNQVSYIHRDYNRKNVLWKDNDFRIIDFETATIGNPSIDFFNSLWFLTNDYEESKLVVFATTYFKYMNIIDDYEIGAYAALIEECNWLYFSLKRALKINTSNDNEIMLGKESISTSLREIINCYNKIDSMVDILNKVVGRNK